jgi:hypothetical protein
MNERLIMKDLRQKWIPSAVLKGTRCVSVDAPARCSTKNRPGHARAMPVK